MLPACCSNCKPKPTPAHQRSEDSLRQQLEEEIRLWWRTDELHQFKPSVLDEVDYALHYFQQVLFDAMPQLRRRRSSVPSQAATPMCSLPPSSFCTFGSWVGSDRDGNPSVTTEITWRTACYQRQLMLERYIARFRTCAISSASPCSGVRSVPPLLESLEMDRLRFPEVYEERVLAISPGALPAQAQLHAGTAASSPSCATISWRMPAGKRPAEGPGRPALQMHNPAKPCTTDRSLNSAATWS